MSVLSILSEILNSRKHAQTVIDELRGRGVELVGVEFNRAAPELMTPGIAGDVYPSSAMSVCRQVQELGVRSCFKSGVG
jgi:hypothetical protein